jgi:ATP-dependent DNA helicase DinG
MSLPASNLIDLSDRLAARSPELVKKHLSPVEAILRGTLPREIPGYEIREPQIEMALMIESALTEQRHGFFEAGTGTGKSIAYLAPLHEHLKATGGRAVVSTGTIALQEQLISKDIPLLENILKESFHARLAKGKSNYLCRVRLESELTQLGGMFHDKEAQELIEIEEWAHSTKSGDRADLKVEPSSLWAKICVDDNCPGRKCLSYSNCFLAKAKALLNDAQLIITNHNLLMLDLVIKDKTDGNASLLPDYTIVVLDEGHKLSSIAQSALSTQCSNYRLPLLLKQARKVPGVDFNLCEDALLQNEAFFNLVAGTPDGKDRFCLIPTDELIIQGNKVLELVESIAKTESDGMSDHDTIVLSNVGKYFDDLVYILSADNQKSNVYWVEKSKTSRGGQKIVLHGTPIDVSEMLSEMLFSKMNSVILTSATLSTGGSFSYLKGQIGCPAAEELIVKSPFDFSQQCLLYLPQDLPEPNSPSFHQGIVKTIYDLLAVTQGRALCLFTSYRGMNEVYQRLEGKLPYQVYKQSDMPKRALLDAFRDDVHSVLFATSSFWEGVSIDGESLSCVIIDRLPFAVPDEPISRARVDRLKKQGKNDYQIFNALTLPEAILSLKQGFGRLIRTRSDRGVVCILDNRVTTKRYGATVLKSLPGASIVRSLGEVERFMGEER